MPIINYSLFIIHLSTETACRLCHARRRETSVVQLRICFTASSLRASQRARQSEQNPTAPPPSHSERSEESISTLNFCERLAALFSFSCTFLCKKVPKSFCTVKMAASVFGRSLSGHGRLTLFRTPAPGARSLDERNPAISTSAESRKNHSRARPGRSRCKREPGSAQNCSVILNEVKNLISTDVSLRST